MHRNAVLVELSTLTLGLLISVPPCFGGAAWSSVAPESEPRNDDQLRAETVANAEVHLAPKMKNPRISDSGFDPAFQRILEQQRAYLVSRPLLAVPETNNGHHETLLPALSEKASEKKPDQLFPQWPSASGRHLSSTVCRAAVIRSVNGTREGAIFTPKEPVNIYRIEGCSFGNARGRVQLEPHSPAVGQPLSPIALQLDAPASSWSDRAINAHLDPHLSGIPDSAVTLVVYAANGQRLEMPGCFFVAVRGERQLLTIIPASWVRLHATSVRSRSIGQLEYVSPPVKGEEVPRNAAGTSVLVVRSDSEEFASGADSYDFSRLNPGWVVDSVQLETYSISCPADIAFTQPFGRWDLTWEQRGFTVSWAGDACRSYPMPFLNFKLSFSQYAAKVWVIGPVGTQPVPRL